MEIWKDVKGYEGLYQVSNHGNIKTLERKVYYGKRYHTVKERIKENSIKQNGYIFLQLSKNNKLKNHYVHRLVAEAFIQNPENKKTVNHKDFDKSNNCVENLEWNTYKENNNHALPFRKERKRDKMIIAFNENEEIKINNLLKWCNDNNHDRAAVYKCLNGESIKHHGYKFKYEGTDVKREKTNYRKGKLIEVEYPNGEIYVIKEGITEWCKNNGLKVQSCTRVARGERNHYKKYKFKYIIY